VSMPVSIAALNQVYSGHASVGPLQLMRQVGIAQLLPLGIGVLAGRYLPSGAAWIKARLDRIWKVLLGLLAVLAITGFWGALLSAGPLVATAACLTTVGAIAIGHLMGGPDPATRTAVAISSSARNPGLALLVVAVNGAPLGVKIAVLSYIVVSAVTILPYVFWRRRQAADVVG